MPGVKAGNCPFCNRRHWKGTTRVKMLMAFYVDVVRGFEGMEHGMANRPKPRTFKKGERLAFIRNNENRMAIFGLEDQPGEPFMVEETIFEQSTKRII